MVATTNDRHTWNVRALLASMGTPFSVAHYKEQAVIFRQGDACDSVIYLEKGRVRLAVMTPGGKRGDLRTAGVGRIPG